MAKIYISISNSQQISNQDKNENIFNANEYGSTKLNGI